MKLALLLLYAAASFHAKLALAHYEVNNTVRVLGSKVAPFSQRSDGKHMFWLPICDPDLKTEEGWAKNSRILNGEQSSAYKIMADGGYATSTRISNTFYLRDIVKEKLCVKEWNDAEKEKMQNAVKDNYYYEFYSDGHFMRAFVGRRENNWFSSKSFVFTHLVFTFMYNENKIVAAYVQSEEEHQDCLECVRFLSVNFTYSVVWLKTELSYERVVAMVPQINFFNDSEKNEKFEVWGLSLGELIAVLIGIVSFLAQFRSCFYFLSQKIKLRQAQKEAAKRPLDEYDMVVKIKWFKQILKTKNNAIYGDGWEVVGSTAALDDTTKTETSMVAVLGLYNKGKTFVLNRLGGTNLPEGITVQTKGISFKRAVGVMKRFTLVDIAGFDAPVKVGKDRKKLGHRKSADTFIQDVVLRLAQAYIVVIGDITLKDQEYLNSLSRKIQEFQKSIATVGQSGEVNPVQSEKFKELIVVHNFAMERDLGRCSDAFREQVTKHYVRGNWIDKETDSKYYMTKAVLGERAGMRHMFIGRSSDPGGEKTQMDLHNEKMFQLLRNWITHVAADDPNVNIVRETLTSCNVVLPDFLNKPPPPLVVVQENSKTFIRFARSDQKDRQPVGSVATPEKSTVEEADSKDPACLDGKADSKDPVCLDGKAEKERRSEIPHTDGIDDEELTFVVEPSYGELTARPRQPAYDILYTDDAAYIHLDSAAVNVQAEYDPQTTSCHVTGYIPKSDFYEKGQLSYRKRYIGHFEFDAFLHSIPGKPSFNSPPELLSSDVKADLDKPGYVDEGTVIKLTKQKRSSTRKA